jgi:predicted component of type VI protein secretion system
VVPTEWASRNHAVIEFKRGFFTIIDRSTNGTFVRLGEDDELRVHWDEMHLRKSGRISLGQAVARSPRDALLFRCKP